MSRLHIVAVGGTGHKVLQSVIHLAACGIFKGNIGPNRIETLRILTVDADVSNGNLSLTKKTFNAYQNFYNALNGCNELGLVNIEAVIPSLNLCLYDGDRDSISSTFNTTKFHEGSDEEKILNFLYTKEEIDTEFNQGFYGHTSIGTLIVKHILKTNNTEANNTWKQFLSGINDNDFVITTGSLFGGTGASSIPIILEELKKRRKEADFKVAALMLNPYFNTVGKINEEGELSPDSSNFHIKAKSSLYYYFDQRQHEMVDVLYIIGEPQTNFSNEAASRGATEQCNKAHPIELFAATSIIDFIKYTRDIDPANNVKTADRHTDGNKYLYTWKMLQNSSQDLPADMQHLMKIAVFFNKIIISDLTSGRDPSIWRSYYDELHLKRDSNNNLVYDNIFNYFKFFINWIYDIHKRNMEEIDQNTGRIKWEIDVRVKLFNAHTKELFNNQPVYDAKIKNLNELVLDENDGLISEKIYTELCSKKPKGSAKDFTALFSVLYDIVNKPQKSLFGFPKKQEAAVVDFKQIKYLAKENQNIPLTGCPPADENKFWSSCAPKSLLSIADNLPMAVGETFTRNDISIPSPWSIFITNELTLTNEKFSGINRDAFNQWCALIALLALRKLNHYESNGFILETPLKESKDDFFDVIKDTCKPRSYIFANQEWIRSSRISFYNKATSKDETIGFLANNTLVCPSYNFTETAKNGLHILAPSIINENGRALSPDNYFKDQSHELNQKSKFALKMFLTDLKKILIGIAGKNNDEIIKSLRDLIDVFINDLGSVKTTFDDITIPPSAIENVHSVDDVFNVLLPSTNSGSSVELPFELKGTIGGERVVLIGLNLAGISSSGSQAANYFITDTVPYSKITLVTITEYDGNLVDGIRLVHDDTLLLDSMILVKKENKENGFESLPHVNSLPDYEIIWPINEKLLSMYRMEDLNDMLSLTADHESITVTLKLGIMGKVAFHTVSKTYRITSLENAQNQQTKTGVCVTMERNRLPFWAVWPFAKAMKDGINHWKRYNFFCVDRIYRGSPVLDIQPVFENLQDNIAGQQRLSTVSTPTFDIFYRRYTDLPVAFRLLEKTKEASVYRGAVFIKNPPVYEQGSIEWNIGLDFGTTSTTAFYTTQNDSNPRFLQLLSEYKWIDGKSTPEEYPLNNGNDMLVLADFGERRYFNEYFIDKQTLEQKGYTTTYEELDETQNASEPTIFKGGRIFWHNYENLRMAVQLAGGRRERLRTNIKWDTNTVYVGKYLNQLITQIAWQAVKNRVRKINWFFSYPTAFSLGDKGEFGNKLDSLISNLEKDTGIVIDYNSKTNLLTESIAAAYYFKSKNSREQVFLCIDIGGGTSDVSIWVKTKYVFQSSIRFASRDMFVEPLKELLSGNVLDVVRTSTTGDNINLMLAFRDNATSDEKTKFFIETLLFEYYDTFKGRLDSLQGKDKSAYKRFKFRVFIAYCGLVYYIANIIAELLNTTKESKHIDNDITTIVFGLSGKGSKLTSWIDVYCDILYNEAKNLIAEKTKSKSNPDGISIKFKPQFEAETAKTETAIGIISNLDNGKQKTDVVPVDPDVFMGSDVDVSNKSGTKTFKSNDFVDTYNDQFFAIPKELSITIKPELNAIDDFLEFFNRIAAKTRNDIPPISSDWLNKERKNLWRLISTEFENRLSEGHFDPPFIVMLDVFLKEFFNE